MANFNAKNWLLTQLPVIYGVIKTKVNTLLNALTGRVDTLETDVTALDGRVTTLETDVAALQSITGAYKGSVATKTDLDNLKGKNGDWAVLTTDDIGTGSATAPEFESGIYVKDPSGWSYVTDITNIEEVNALVLNRNNSQSELDAELAIRDAALGDDPSNVSAMYTDKIVNPGFENKLVNVRVLWLALSSINQMINYLGQSVTQLFSRMSSAEMSLQSKANLTGSATNEFEVKPALENTDQAVNANQFTDNITQAEAEAIWDGI